MNTTMNRSGKMVTAVGAPNSYARILCEERLEEVTEIVQEPNGNFIPVKTHVPSETTVLYAELMDLKGIPHPTLLEFSVHKEKRVYAMEDSTGKLWYWETL